MKGTVPAICQREGCHNPIAQLPGNHRQRQYCSNTCKQSDYRRRDKENQFARRQAELHEHWVDFLPETLDLFDLLLRDRGQDAARQVADIISRERGRQWQAIDTSCLDELKQAMEEERAKFTTLLDDYMQLAKKTSNLESQVQRVGYMKLLKSRESMLQELMLLGGRLNYASMTDLGIQEGIDTWLNYIRQLSDEDLAKAIAHGYWQADNVAMAAIEASDQQTSMQLRQRIDGLERDAALRDARIEELEHGQSWEPGDALSTEQIQQLVYHARERQITVERQAQQIAALEREVFEKVTKIHKLQESHGSTLFAMNALLGAAQSAQHEGAGAAVRIKELERNVEQRQNHESCLEQELARYRQVIDLDSICPWTALTSVQEYMRDHIDEAIPIKRRGKTIKIIAIDDHARAVSELHGLIRLNDEEIEQCCEYVSRKLGEPVFVRWMASEEEETEQSELREANLRIAQLEQELSRYRQLCDLDDRQRMVLQGMALGAQIGYKPLITIAPPVQAGEEIWKARLQQAETEELAQIIAIASHYAENLIWLDIHDELRQARRRIAELERQQSSQSRLVEEVRQR